MTIVSGWNNNNIAATEFFSDERIRLGKVTCLGLSVTANGQGAFAQKINAAIGGTNLLAGMLCRPVDYTVQVYSEASGAPVAGEVRISLGGYVFGALGSNDLVNLADPLNQVGTFPVPAITNAMFLANIASYTPNVMSKKGVTGENLFSEYPDFVIRDLGGNNKMIFQAETVGHVNIPAGPYAFRASCMVLIDDMT